MPDLPDHAEFLARRYFSSLDVFRCGSILAVLWHHSHEGVPWFPASRMGFLGVDFFFVISGFLIVTLLLRERDRAGAISLRRFYLRRALRIFPIYYGVLGAMTAFYLFVRPHTPMARRFFEELPFQACYLSNLARNTTILFFTWSLSTEEQFYMLWPPIEKWLGRAAVAVLLGVIALNQCVNFGLIRGLGEVFKGDQNIFQITFTPICLGVLLAHLLHDRRGFDRLSGWLGRRWMPLVLLGVLVLACNLARGDVRGWQRPTLQLAMTALLASSVVREDHGLNRLLGAPAIRRVGVISYGMYIYHMFINHAIRDLLGGIVTRPIVFFLLSVALTVLVAEVSFRFYETPFLRLKDIVGHRASRARVRELAESRAS